VRNLASFKTLVNFEPGVWKCSKIFEIWNKCAMLR